MSLSLNCFVLGDNLDQIFTVKIPHTKNVDILKNLIKEKNPVSLGDKDINLWRVSFPIDGLEKEDIDLLNCQMLSPPSEKLATFFTDVADDCLHVVVKAPALVFTHLLSLNCFFLGDDPKRMFTVKVPKTDNISILKDLIKEKTPVALSNVDAKDIDLWQVSFPIDGLETHLENIDLLNYQELWPPSKKLATVFTDVADDCLHVAIKAPKVQTVVAPDSTRLLSLNCFFLGDDPDRMFTVKVPKTNNISILKDLIKEKKSPHLNHLDTSDLNLWQVSFPIADLPSKNPPTTLGPKLTSERLLSDVFSSQLNRYHIHVIACVLGQGPAFSDNPLVAMRNRNHPYPTSFTARDGSVKRFTYLYQKNGRDLFFGRLDVDGTTVCIKFAPCYCEEGHEFLAAKGFAPKLYAVERLPGGSYIVVMEDISVEYDTLFNVTQDIRGLRSDDEHLGSRNSLSEKLGQCLRQFHQAGFVHGDIRDTNIMVKRCGFDDGSFLVVDYDFCGKAQQVRYPLGLNTTSVWRPEGATGGAIIEAEHDLQMLAHIWDP